MSIYRTYMENGGESELRKLFMQKIREISRADSAEVNELLAIADPGDLSRFVRMPFHEIEKCINAPMYYELCINKKSGKGKRLIQEPSRTLKQIQRALNDGFGLHYSLIRPDVVHGFIRATDDAGYGIVSNALPHVGSDFVVNIDLKDFFPSIGVRRVKEVLDSELFSFGDHISTSLALLMTYKGKLPQGAPTSPVISNYVCLPLDHQLQAFAAANGLSYSRYADDLTFSGKGRWNSAFFGEIYAMIEGCGFTVNTSKTRLKGKGRRQMVTGLVVNQRVNAERKRMKQIRAMLHDAEKNGIWHAANRHFGSSLKDPSQLERSFLNKLEGCLSFIRILRGDQDSNYQRYKEQLVRIKKAHAKQIEC